MTTYFVLQNANLPPDEIITVPVPDGGVLPMEYARAGWSVLSSTTDPGSPPATSFLTRAAGDSIYAPVSGSANYAPTADALAIAVGERDGINAARRYAGQAIIDYSDSAAQTTDWSILTGLPSNNVQISSNKLFANNTQTNPCVAYIPLPSAITVGQKFHVATFIDYLTGGGSSAVFVGLSTKAPGDTGFPTSQPDDVSVGLTGAGAPTCVVGSNLTSAITAGAAGSWVATSGRYEVTLDGDENTISLAIRHTADSTRTHYWKFPTSALTTLGKTIGRIMCYVGDSRGTSGHDIGPVAVNLFSQQPSRTKTIASLAVEGLAHRDVGKIAVSSSDNWRIQLPANYDPRRPAPLVLYLHQAQSSTAPVDRPWAWPSTEGPISKALGDAGYIVASAQDGFVVGSPNTDRYGNAASMANILDLYQYVRSHFAVSSVVLYGPSMGGLTGTNIIARRTIPNIAAAYFICPSTDLSVVYGTSGFSAPINAAFGITGTPPNDYATATASYNSALRNGWEFRGVPMRMVAVSDDTIAPPAQQVDPFLAKIAPYTSEASKLTIASGGHLAAAAFSASDVMTFLNAHVPV